MKDQLDEVKRDFKFNQNKEWLNDVMQEGRLITLSTCLTIARQTVSPHPRPMTVILKQRESVVRVEVDDNKNQDLEVEDINDEEKEEADNKTNVSFTSKKWNNIDELIEVLKEELSQPPDNTSQVV